MAEPMSKEQTIVHAACPHDCPDTCAMLVTVENGEVTQLRTQVGGAWSASDSRVINLGVVAPREASAYFFSLVPRLGTETEVVDHILRLRLGGYLEPAPSRARAWHVLQDAGGAAVRRPVGRLG